MSAAAYFMFTPGSYGPHIRGPLSLAEVSAALDLLERDTGRKPVLSDRMPDWEYAPDDTIVVVRGEVVLADAVRLCACGSGQPFWQCHGGGAR